MTHSEITHDLPPRKRLVHPTPLTISLEIARELSKDAAEGNEPAIPVRVSSLIDKAITRACLAHEAEE